MRKGRFVLKRQHERSVCPSHTLTASTVSHSAEDINLIFMDPCIVV